MKRTSATVLALLFASSQAIKLSEVDNSLTQNEDAAPENKKKKTDPISPENYDPWVYKSSKDAMPVYPISHDTTVYGPVSEAESKHKKKHKKHKKDIGERGYDTDVQQFVWDAIPPMSTRERDQWSSGQTLPFVPNGSHPSAHSPNFSQKKKKDIGERGYDTDVQQFVWDAIPPMSTRERNQWSSGQTLPFVPNGSHPSAHSPNFSQQKKNAKDIGERGYDTDVQQFVWDAIPPMSTRERNQWSSGQTLPFVPNGSHPSAHSPNFSQKKKKDIGERGYDTDVQQFVWDAIPPMSTRERNQWSSGQTLPFVPNGSHPSAHSPNFSQKKKKAKAKDMGETGYDPEVYGFTRDLVSAINGQERTDSPYDYNGGLGWDAFAEGKHHGKHHKHRRPDVAERGMDEEVHGFVKDKLPPLTEWKRSSDAFVPNGSDPSAHDPSFSQHHKKHHRKHHKRPDVAERGMEEEVHGFVKENLPPLTEWKRSSDAFVPNGSDPSAHDSFAQVHKQPEIIDEPGWTNQNVQPFSSNALPPLSEQWGSEYAWTPNGSNPISHAQKQPEIIDEPGWTNHNVQPFSSDALPPLSEQWGSEYAWTPNGSNPISHSQKPSEDIAERNMDNHFVHPFSADQDVVLPTPNPWTRPYLPWKDNGGSNVYAQYNAPQKDIAERNMDNHFVHPFSADQDVVLPTPNPWTRPYLPWKDNGGSNVYAQYNAPQKDIAERNMDNHFVHPFSADQDVVLPTANPWTRPYLPWKDNGGSNVYAQYNAPKKDIANKEVRPDVYVEAHKHLNPIAMGRYREHRQEAEPEDRTWDDGPKPKEPPAPEFTFKKPKEVDEDAELAKRKAEAVEGYKKAAAEKQAKDAEAAEPDEDAAEKTPSKKEAKAVTEEDALKAKNDEEAEKQENEAADKADKDEDDAKKKKEAEEAK